MGMTGFISKRKMAADPITGHFYPDRILTKIIPNHEYYVVELTSFPDVTRDWLHERFGAPNGRRWWFRYPKIYFLDKHDHMMFVLRWS
jgi:hypothetical protein